MISEGERAVTSTTLGSFVYYLRADQQQTPGWLPINPTQSEELQTFWEVVESEASPRDHAILLERVAVHNLEPGSQYCRQLSTRKL